MSNFDSDFKPMFIRSLFKLTDIKHSVGGGCTLYFSTQYNDSIPESNRFQKATPWGTIKMHVDNPSALEYFKLGEYYHADFSKLDLPEWTQPKIDA